MQWSEERIETLTRMWSEGQSASQIAKELGSVTRNAVIGKVHRLGLSPRVPEEVTPDDAEDSPQQAGEEGNRIRKKPGGDEAQADAPQTVAETQAEPRRIGPVRPTGKPIVPADQPLPPRPSANEVSPEARLTVREVRKQAKKLNLMDLTERTGKWPVGDPATDDFWFCGLATAPGKPYCQAHANVAFQPMSPRRDRRR